MSWIIHFNFFDLCKKLCSILGLKRRKSSIQLISKHSKRPNINSSVMRPPFYNFRAKVIRGSAHCPSFCIWGVNGPSKVSYFQGLITLLVLRNQNVLRFDIPVNDIHCVHVLKRFSNLQYVIRRDLFAKFSLFYEFLI